MTDTVLPSYKAAPFVFEPNTFKVAVLSIIPAWMVFLLGAAPVSYGESDIYQQGVIWHVFAIVLAVILKVFIYDKTVISNMSYNLDEEGVTVKTGLFNITTKSFRYLDIVSIQHQQNFIEASSGVGTITIRTPSEDAIKLKQLPNHMEIFELIQSKRKGNL